MKVINKIILHEIVSNSFSYSEVCRKLGWSVTGYNIKKAKELVLLNCDSSHFSPFGRNRKHEKVERSCLYCEEKFFAIKGSKKHDKKCCSRSCANKLRGGEVHHKWKEKGNCLNCDKELTETTRDFCSQTCVGQYTRKQVFKKIENGTYVFNNKVKGNSKNRILKLYLIHKNGHKCSVCELNEWMNKLIPLQLDHKDGDSHNDSLNNIRLICPNCHAQTPNYCGKNKGNGKRKHRNDDYKNGKGNW